MTGYPLVTCRVVQRFHLRAVLLNVGHEFIFMSHDTLTDLCVPLLLERQVSTSLDRDTGVAWAFCEPLVKAGDGGSALLQGAIDPELHLAHLKIQLPNIEAHLACGI